MKTAILVPARLASRRFPRKLLHPVRGKPILLWTAERIVRELPEYPLFFAVAEPELAECLESAGFQVVMTDPALPSGTDRLAAANEALGAGRIINVQADEPLVRGEDVRLMDRLLTADVDIATVATPFSSEDAFRSSARVKVVRDAGGHALYFSRAPIPFDRDSKGTGSRDALWHLGLYAYNARFLKAFSAMPPGRLEQTEKLEQLRALEAGYRIAVGVVPEGGIGIDTPEDAKVFEEMLTLKR